MRQGWVMAEETAEQAPVERPTSADAEAWKIYWQAQGMHWRTEPEIIPERQAYLAARRAIPPAIDQGIYPFKEVTPHLTRADLEWLLATHAGGRGPVVWTDEQLKPKADRRVSLDLRGADLRDLDLSGLPLDRLAAGAAPPLPDDETGTPTREPTESGEQRRVLTILFADLASSTALFDVMDSEDVRELLSAFFNMMAREIHRHGGTIEKYIGDAVMAVFGLPLAHDDDPLRAVRAALDMQAALLRFNAARRANDANEPELLMRIGINTGDVVADVAGSDARDFLVTGDAVNMAARFQQIAPSGRIVVGPRTRQSTTSTVKYHALAPLMLRGSTRATRVWEVVELLDAGEWLTATETQREQAQIHLENADLSGAHLKGADLFEAQLEGADLSEAQLESADLRGARLRRTILTRAQLKGATLFEARLDGADLRGAQLEGADLSGAQLEGADLRGAQLKGTNLSGAQLAGADLGGAQLEGAILRQAQLAGANLSGAQLAGANLREAQLAGADLRLVFFDSATTLNDVTLVGHRSGIVKVADVRWGGVNLAVIEWGHVIAAGMGDEQAAWEWKPAPFAASEQYKSQSSKEEAEVRKQWQAGQRAERLRAFQAAVRTDRQLATALRDQGMNEEADQLSYRAQVLQRKVYLQQKKRARATLWGFLDLVAGYGYKPGRSLVTYAVVIVAFTFLYLLAGQGVITFGLAATAYHGLPWYEALVLSVASFHGRGFFQPVQSPGDPIAILAAIEAIFGLFIEVSFIATFTQRFFGK
jgi:class 3 adenylate cyclase